MFRKFLAASALATVAVFVIATVAGAHALVRASDPASGAFLDEAPARVTITFTERPDASLSIIHVLDSSGRSVESGRARPVSANPLQLTVALGSVPHGVYTVTWRTVSRVDGHVTAGAFAFGVGVSPAGATPPPASVVARTPPPSPLAVAGRLFLYAGLAVLAGAAATTLFVFRGAPGRRSALGLGWAVAVTGLVVTIVAEASAIGVSVARLLGTSTGTGYVRQLVAIGVVGVVVAIAVLLPGRGTFGLAGLGALGLIITHVIAGHAGGAEHNAALKVAVQSLHMVVAASWIGGLGWLLLGIRGASADDRVTAVRRFSRMAGYLIGLVVLTGSVRALDLVGSWRRLWTTSFGTAVLIKVGLLMVLGFLGAFNRWRNIPAPGSASGRFTALRRVVIAEIAVAALVFGATGALAGLPPPSLVAASRAPESPRNVVATGNDFATSVRIRLTVTPGTAGPNTFEVRIADYDTGEAVGATRVALRLSLPSRPDIGAQVVELESASDLLWRARSASVAIQGRWSVAVVIEKPSGNLEVPLRFETRLPPQETTVSRQAGQPTLYTIALDGGRSVQAYLDPGEKPGPNDVHFTFFDAKGNEQPVEEATMEAVPPEGGAFALTVRRFGPGHFVASVTLASGSWRFHVLATAGGQNISAYFSQRIP